ncbi:MAG: hypothetical protein QMA97_04790 [Glaciecola sp.]
MSRLLLLSVFFLVSSFANAEHEIHKLNENVEHKTQVMVLGSLHPDSYTQIF